jgi:hypothetical protein
VLVVTQLDLESSGITIEVNSLKGLSAFFNCKRPAMESHVDSVLLSESCGDVLSRCMTGAVGSVTVAHCAYLHDGEYCRLADVKDDVGTVLKQNPMMLSSSRLHLYSSGRSGPLQVHLDGKMLGERNSDSQCVDEMCWTVVYSGSEL